MLSIFSQYIGTGFWLAIGAIEAIMLACFSMALAKPDSRARTLNWLRAPKGTKFYDRTVGGLLLAIDRGLDNPNFANDGHTAWSASLLDIAMRLAIAYPILSLVMYWGLTGNASGLGNLELFPTEESYWGHAALLIKLLFGTALYIVSVSLFTPILGNKHASTNRIIIYSSQIFIFSFIVLSSSGSLPSSIIAGSAIAALLTLPGAYGIATSAGVAFGFLFGNIFVAAGTIIFTIAIIFFRYNRHALAPVFSYWLYLLTWLGVASITLSLYAVNEDRTSMILFLMIFPIINGVFDFLSFGATRHFIARGVAARGRTTIFWGLADLVAAALLFTTLGCTLVLAITFFNFVSLTPLLDLGETLKDIAENPHRYWWLYIGTFSTVLPTMIHFGLTGLCFVSWVPSNLRTWIATAIEHKTDGFQNFFGHVALSLLGTVLVVLALLPLYLLVVLTFEYYPDIGRAYLWIITQVANAFGAGVEKSEIMNCVSCARAIANSSLTARTPR